MRFLSLAVLALIASGCATSPKNSNPSDEAVAAAVANSSEARDVASGRCLFDLDEAEGRRIKLYFRKARSFNSDDHGLVMRLPPFYKKMIAHYMNQSRSTPGGFNAAMVREYLSGDGGFVQRIVWGRGSNKRTFMNVSHYPGHNHYGTIYETTNNTAVPVAQINDGDFERCTIPAGFPR